jgi:serine/threonine protein kinase
MAIKPESEPTRISQSVETPSEPAATFPPGSLVGDFLVLKEIGRGAFARVYLSRQVSLNRDVALKVSQMSSDEGRTLARLDHPNIVRVYSDEFRADLGVRLTAVQYIPGITLEALLQRSPPAHLGQGAWLQEIRSAADPGILGEGAPDSSLDQFDTFQSLLWTGVRLSRALDHAHRQGILHLDLKPANILVDKTGFPYLADFNVSGTDALISLGTPSTLGGTPMYMSPEQKRATENPTPEIVRAITVRSDLYSLGKVLRTLADHLKLLDAEPGAPAAGTECEAHRVRFRSVLDRAQAPNPEARYKSATELADELQSCLEFAFLRQGLPAGQTTHGLPSASRRLLGALLLMGGAGSLANFVARSNSDFLPPARLVFFQISLFFVAPVGHLCFFLWLRSLFKKLGDLSRQDLTGSEFEKKGESVRRGLVLLPKCAAAYVFLGWVLGSGAFRIQSAIFAPSLPIKIGVVLLVPVALLTTSFAFQSALKWSLRVGLPRLWARTQAAARSAEIDLKSLSREVAFYRNLSVYVPLAIAAAVILNNRNQFDIDMVVLTRIRVFEFLFVGGWQVKATERATLLIDRTAAAVEKVRALFRSPG